MFYTKQTDGSESESFESRCFASTLCDYHRGCVYPTLLKGRVTQKELNHSMILETSYLIRLVGPYANLDAITALR